MNPRVHRQPPKLGIGYRFIPIPVDFIARSASLTHSEILVCLVVLAETVANYNFSTGKRPHSAVISIDSFVRQTGLPRRTVDYAINALKEKQIIRVTGSFKRPRTFEYLFTQPVETSTFAITKVQNR